MHGADLNAGWFQAHVIVELVGDGSSRDDRVETGAFFGPQCPRDRIEVEVGPPRTPPECESLHQHLDDAVELFNAQISIDGRFPDEVVERF